MRIIGETEFHENDGCFLFAGPRGGLQFHLEIWRKNGQIKTWKRDPDRYRIPLKRGFYGPYSYLTNENEHEFHLRGDCRVLQTLQQNQLSARYIGLDTAYRYLRNHVWNGMRLIAKT